MIKLSKLIGALCAVGGGTLQAGVSAATPAAVPDEEVAARPLISYDYAQAMYSHVWLEDGLLGSGSFEDQDGYALSWQHPLAERFYGCGGVGQLFSSDAVALGPMLLDGEMRSFNALLGAGLHLPVTHGIDWIFQVGGTYNRSRVDVAGSTPMGLPYSYEDAVTSDGFGVQAATGFRMAVNHWLEVSLLYPLAWSKLDSEVLRQKLEEKRRAEHSVFGSVIFRKLGGGPFDLALTALVSENARRISAGLRLNF